MPKFNIFILTIKVPFFQSSLKINSWKIDGRGAFIASKTWEWRLFMTGKDLRRELINNRVIRNGDQASFGRLASQGLKNSS